MKSKIKIPGISIIKVFHLPECHQMAFQYMTCYCPGIVGDAGRRVYGKPIGTRVRGRRGGCLVETLITTVIIYTNLNVDIFYLNQKSGHHHVFFSGRMRLS